jgi:Uma2 family endonuclease
MVLEYPIELPIQVDEFILMALSANNNHMKMERSREGNLIVMSPSGSRVSKFQFKIVSVLDSWNEEENLGLGFDSQAGFRLPDGSVMSPDVSWLSYPKWKALTEEQQNSFAPVCPEFVIEVMSPGDSVEQQKQKMQRWLENGCELGWLIQPMEKKVWVFRKNQKEEDYLEGFTQQLSGQTVLPGFVLDLSKLEY